MLLAAVSANAVSVQPLSIRPGERLLVLAPHPDDEVLAAAGLMQKVLALGGRVRVVMVTAGDGYVEAVEHESGRLRPRPADYLNYGEIRLAEARQACRVLGGGRIIRLDFLGFPDGGIHPLLAAYWNRLYPERSATTGVEAVPYPEAEDRNARYDGSDLRNQIVRILEEDRPTLIVFPDAMDRHPDHDGLSLFTLLAVGDWLDKQGSRTAHSDKPHRLRLLAYLVHWRHGWPSGSDAALPADLSQESLYLPDDLPGRGHQRACLSLGQAQRTLKREALDQYQTQQRAMGPFLSAFVRATECYSVLKIPDAENVEEQVRQRLRSRHIPN